MRHSGNVDSGPDAVRMYLNEIGQVDLLTADDERRLGKAIKDGLAAQAQMDAEGSSLGLRERRALQRVVNEGVKAKDHMVRANLRLVVSIARRYDRKELHLADLIQEGNIGLMHAADKYDFEKGFKFSTYATWWIRQAMTRAMADQGRNIRIPGHMMEVVNRVNRVERELATQLERDPSPEEVAERAGLSVEKLLEVMQIAVTTTSLDAPVGADTDDLTVGDTIADDNSANDPSQLTERRQLALAVEQTLNDLPERDQEIVAMRFGIPHDIGGPCATQGDRLEGRHGHCRGSSGIQARPPCRRGTDGDPCGGTSNRAAADLGHHAHSGARLRARGRVPLHRGHHHVAVRRAHRQVLRTRRGRGAEVQHRDRRSRPPV
ncbi:MAG: sigma-70 family RNA polymerase sigma factor [Actinobacteria bacterium]|nr:sigma-70 family RNA polymerase sigma factor [Actinomycetota bacterium]